MLLFIITSLLCISLPGLAMDPELPPLKQLPLEIINTHIIPRMNLASQAALANSCKDYVQNLILHAQHIDTKKDSNKIAQHSRSAISGTSREFLAQFFGFVAASGSFKYILDDSFHSTLNTITLGGMCVITFVNIYKSVDIEEKADAAQNEYHNRAYEAILQRRQQNRITINHY